MGSWGSDWSCWLYMPLPLGAVYEEATLRQAKT